MVFLLCVCVCVWGGGTYFCVTILNCFYISVNLRGLDCIVLYIYILIDFVNILEDFPLTEVCNIHHGGSLLAT
jgi:hypothetical protein